MKPLVEILSRPDAGTANEILGYEAVSEDNEAVGHVKDYVFDSAGRLSALVIETGTWIFGKKFAFPVASAWIRQDTQQVILRNLMREQVEALPEYHPGDAYRENGRDESRGKSLADQGSPAAADPQPGLESGLLRFNLLEERPQINKHPEKQGEVVIRKVVETYIETIEVPVTVERLIIESSDTVEIVTSRGRPAQRPVQRYQDQERNPVSIEEESVTVTACKEVLEISKRKVVVEEVTLRKVKETYAEAVEVPLQKEVLYIDNPIREDGSHRSNE
jgi:stress response protein YsnF